MVHDFCLEVAVRDAHADSVARLLDFIHQRAVFSPRDDRVASRQDLQRVQRLEAFLQSLESTRLKREGMGLPCLGAMSEIVESLPFRLNPARRREKAHSIAQRVQCGTLLRRSEEHTSE